MSDVILKVENLRSHFKSKKKIVKAVDGVSFQVERGEVFGLVGESGCGKTTLGRSIVGLIDIVEGGVYFNDELIISPKRRKYLKEIQMIFQDPMSSLNPRMTVGEIVGEGLKIRGFRSDEILEEVKRILQTVGLSPEHISRFPHEFSGGQRQRIGIARSLILRPELVIADEPVSALDVSIQAQVINLLNELKSSLNLTFLFIAHDLSVVKFFSDKIAVMYQGKILELAPSDELFSNPLHPYTKSLLSAIPIPDPKKERERVRIIYNDEWLSGELREVCGGHFVLCTSEELAEINLAQTKHIPEPNPNPTQPNPEPEPERKTESEVEL